MNATYEINELVVVNEERVGEVKYSTADGYLGVQFLGEGQTYEWAAGSVRRM